MSGARERGACGRAAAPWGAADLAGALAAGGSEGRPEWFERLERPSARAVYLHLPFCVSKCAYCDFASFATPSGDPLMEAYADALASQLAEAADAGVVEGVRWGYVGGGTPTHVGPPLARLTRTVASLGALEELSVEANPESLDDGMADLLASSFVTRVSVGVQSTDDAELAALGRAHTAEQALSALSRVVSRGLRASADLMCGIPLQTPASFARSLDDVAATGVGHVSVYPLTVEEGTDFSRRVVAREMEPPDDDAEALYMCQAERSLLSWGLTRYEVASYAVAGDECLHNEAYWTGEPYLGLGSSAASMLTREGYGRLRRLVPGLPEAAGEEGDPDACWRVRLVCTSGRAHVASRPRLADQSFEVEQLTLREALAEDLMLGARLQEGLAAPLVAAAREVLGEGRVDACLAGLRADGLLDERLAPTERGWLLGNEVYGRLWDLAEDGGGHAPAPPAP